jgi:two-component system chemotaxis response regulator CheY
MPDHKALIVEDSPTMRGFLGLALQRIPGITYKEAKDGVDAARILDQEVFDVVLLDINMPGMNGLQLLKRIRKDPRLAATRVIMITTEWTENSAEEARALGADGYVPKPVQAHQVIDTVKRLLSTQ